MQAQPVVTHLIPTPPTSTAVACAQQKGRRTRRLQSSSSEAYAKDVALFGRFGGTIPCDAAAVLRYIEVMRARKIAPSTAYRRLMSIQRVHVDGNHPCPTDDPQVRNALRILATSTYPPKPGAKATVPAKAPTKRTPRSAKPVTRDLLARMCDALGRDPLDRRDRAILLVGFMSGLKRQRLVTLDVEDVAFGDNVMTLRLRDQAGQLIKTLTVPATTGELDAVTAVRQYIEYLALESGPLFCSFNRASEPTTHRLAAAFVSCIVKARLATVGVDPAPFSAESLRRGRDLESGVRAQ